MKYHTPFQIPIDKSASLCECKVRTGEVRVLLGSTQEMGAGTNVQDRLVAVRHLDVGWRPADMTQRNGRIIRQGNRNKQVQIFQHVTEGTFDACLYQTLENKQKFISLTMKINQEKKQRICRLRLVKDTYLGPPAIRAC